MAEISVRGYVNKPKTVEGPKGKFSSFTLSEKQKTRTGETTRVFYNVTDFKNPTPPDESSYVTLKGYLNVRDYEKDGVKRQSLDIVASSLDVAPPMDTRPKTEKAPDDWDL